MVKYKTAFLCSFTFFCFFFVKMKLLCEESVLTKAKESASGLTGTVAYSFTSVQLETLPPTRYFVYQNKRSKS